MENPEFLKQKYNLHNTPEVESAARRTEARTDEKMPQDPNERIQNYLDRFKKIIDREDSDKRERGMEALKKILHDKFVIKPEEIPESYFENQRRIAREQGHGDIEVTEEMRRELTEVAIADQESTLDNWVDYLSSKDAIYPDWLKYYTFRSMLNLGEYDKENKKFTKRSKGTVKPFPDLNREALAYVLDAIEKKSQKEKISTQFQTEEEKQEFEKLLQGENFGKLYAYAIDKVTPASKEALETVEGQWVKYDQGNDHMPLVKSLHGHGTGWCTAGESTAQAQLQNGDFYVFYSNDQDGNPTVPRAAIRMEGQGKIAEVRGVAPEQNLDSHITETVKEKLNEFGQEGRAYEKKSEDMKKLTEIEKKILKKQQLNKEDLIFLYEIDQPIEGFGYQKDPRIKEIRDARNPIEDAPIIFECEPSQIAIKPEDINENTKAYIGELGPGIFETLSRFNIEHVYARFLEGKIEQFAAEIGGRSEKEIMDELEAREQLKEDDENKLYAGNSSKYMLKSDDFIRSLYKNPDEPREKWELKDKEQIKFIKLKVSDLGFSKGATTEEVYNRAEELGLELCPPEAGPEIRLNYKKIFNRDQPKGEYFRIGMKQITDSDGNPRVFHVFRSDDGWQWLHDSWANPGDRWDSDSVFVFRPRKSET